MATWVLYKNGSIVREPDPPTNRYRQELPTVVVRLPYTADHYILLRQIQVHIKHGLPWKHILEEGNK